MNYAVLEALDKKYGRTITVEDWRRLSEKAPKDYTDDDVVIVEAFAGPAAAAAARARREHGLAPPVPPAPVTTTKAAAPSLTRKVIEDYIQKYSEVIVPVLRKRFDELEARLEAQAQEIAALRARPLQKWAGVHITGTPYAEASLVTKSGSLWVATTATTTTPGDPGGDWRLIVKKGHASGAP